MVFKVLTQHKLYSMVKKQFSVENKSKFFTVDKYNDNIGLQIKQKKVMLRNLLIASSITALLFRGGPVVNNSLEFLVHITKMSWVIPVPFFLIQFIASYTVLTKNMLISPESLSNEPDYFSDKKIFFTVLTLGKNLNTVRETVQSNNYWIKNVQKKYNINFSAETWVITEEDSYLEKRAIYDQLEIMGAKIIVTPKEYNTPNNTKFKARALHYCTELRRKLGSNTHKEWVYHQDEETMIGEDTVLGILDFIKNAGKRVMGSGIILYPQNWKNNFISTQETSRSVNDISLLGQINDLGYSLFGYHGSHFIVRADVEDSVGWDFGISRSEDLLFSIKVNNIYGNLMAPLKGFTYEKPPFTLSDQQKQRKRWILGALEVLFRSDVRANNKILIAYGLLSWFSALPSFISVILNSIINTGGLIRYGGFLSGFIWFMIYNYYKTGQELHRKYIGPPNPSGGVGSVIKKIVNVLAGLLTDSISPWNAILNPTSTYDCIEKDEVNGLEIVPS